MSELGDAIERGDRKIESLQPVAGSPTIQGLKAKYFDAIADCADLKVKYLAQHPKLEA
jgi:uncharacterized protein involved in exopolysaccharide biosynthesis